MKRLLLISILALLNIFVSNAQTVFTKEINTNQIAYDSKRQEIVATVGGTDNNYANSFVAIDPTTGNVIKQINIGLDPTKFVFTTDSNFVFICFDGVSQIVKLDLRSYSVVQTITLGNDSVTGSTMYGLSIATLKNNDSTFIVSKKVNDISPSYVGVSAYQNGKMLQNSIVGFEHSGFLIDELISTPSDTLYGMDTEDTGNSFYIMTYSSDSGLTMNKYQYYQYIKHAKLENGLLYDDNGFVINPSIPAQVGSFPLEKKISSNNYVTAADFLHNKVFFAQLDYSHNNILLYSYDETTFSKIANISVPFSLSAKYSYPKVSQLIRFGNKGLATSIYEDYSFNSQGKALVIFNNLSLIDSMPIKDTVGLTKSFVLDTIYTHKTIYDTLVVPIYTFLSIYDTLYYNVNDTLIINLLPTFSTINTIVSKVSIYPNPTSSVLNITIENSNYIFDYIVQIYNSIGQSMFETTINSNSIEIDVSKFTKGTYVLLIKKPDQKTISTKSFIVK